MAKNRMVNEEADCKGEHPDELWGITNYQNAEKCRKPKRNLPQGLLNAINEIKVRESRYDGYLMKHYTRNVDCYGNLNNANDFYRAVKRFENDLLNKRFKLRSQARDSGATEDEKKEIDARLEKDLELVKVSQR